LNINLYKDNPLVLIRGLLALHPLKGVLILIITSVLEYILQSDINKGMDDSLILGENTSEKLFSNRTFCRTY